MWLGHLQRMDPGRIPKDLGELAEGSCPVGRPRLRYKDICKRDMKLSHVNINNWENYAGDGAKRRTTVREGVEARSRKTRKETKTVGKSVLVAN